MLYLSVLSDLFATPSPPQVSSPSVQELRDATGRGWGAKAVGPTVHSGATDRIGRYAGVRVYTGRW